MTKDFVEFAAGGNPFEPQVDRKELSCKAFKADYPMTYSHVPGDPKNSDTKKTIGNVRKFNAAYEALNCPKD